MVRLVAILAIGTLVAACSSSGDRQPEAPVIEKEGSTPSVPGSSAGAQDPKPLTGRIGTVTPPPVDELTSGTGLLAKRSIYFDQIGRASCRERV